MSEKLKQIEELLSNQLDEWKLAADNYDQLNRLRLRTVEVDGMTIRLQCNPERIRSSSARVDKAAIAARPCFLCNAPSEQKSVPIANSFEVLVNPYPIFSSHLTIRSKKHEPQRIATYIEEMIDIVDDLKGWFVFYNGPSCGASAPDHLHFQAGKCADLPLWENIERSRKEFIYQTNDVEVCDVSDYPSPLLIFSSSNKKRLSALLLQTIMLLPIKDGEDEPMLNLLSWETRGRINVALFPRGASRPRCFYEQEPSKHFMVSPATVEMSGLLILPHAEDFERISAGDIKKVYEEVGLDKQTFVKYKETLKRTL